MPSDCARNPPDSLDGNRTDVTMRKKNAGALYMDFQISPDDRVGGGNPKKSRGRSPRPAGPAPAITTSHRLLSISRVGDLDRCAPLPCVRSRIDGGRLDVTNLGKIFWPALGLTKGETSFDEDEFMDTVTMPMSEALRQVQVRIFIPSRRCREAKGEGRSRMS